MATVAVAMATCWCLCPSVEGVSYTAMGSLSATLNGASRVSKLAISSSGRWAYFAAQYGGTWMESAPCSGCVNPCSPSDPACDYTICNGVDDLPSLDLGIAYFNISNACNASVNSYVTVYGVSVNSSGGVLPDLIANVTIPNPYFSHWVLENLDAYSDPHFVQFDSIGLAYVSGITVTKNSAGNETVVVLLSNPSPSPKFALHYYHAVFLTVDATTGALSVDPNEAYQQFQPSGTLPADTANASLVNQSMTYLTDPVLLAPSVDWNLTANAFATAAPFCYALRGQPDSSFSSPWRCGGLKIGSGYGTNTHDATILKATIALRGSGNDTCVRAVVARESAYCVSLDLTTGTVSLWSWTNFSRVLASVSPGGPTQILTTSLVNSTSNESMTASNWDVVYDGAFVTVFGGSQGLGWRFGFNSSLFMNWTQTKLSIPSTATSPFLAFSDLGDILFTDAGTGRWMSSASTDTSATTFASPSAVSAVPSATVTSAAKLFVVDGLRQYVGALSFNSTTSSVTFTSVLRDTSTAAPTTAPTNVPTTAPTSSPTDVPTASPTSPPTDVPTTVPTGLPSIAPTVASTSLPTAVPTTEPTSAPTQDEGTASPSPAPTVNSSLGDTTAMGCPSASDETDIVFLVVLWGCGYAFHVFFAVFTFGFEASRFPRQFYEMVVRSWWCPQETPSAPESWPSERLVQSTRAMQNILHVLLCANLLVCNVATLYLRDTGTMAGRGVWGASYSSSTTEGVVWGLWSLLAVTTVVHWLWVTGVGTQTVCRVLITLAAPLQLLFLVRSQPYASWHSYAYPVLFAVFLAASELWSVSLSECLNSESCCSVRTHDLIADDDGESSKELSYGMSQLIPYLVILGLIHWDMTGIPCTL